MCQEMALDQFAAASEEKKDYSDRAGDEFTTLRLQNMFVKLY
jgi:hypothetical protein